MNQRYFLHNFFFFFFFLRIFCSKSLIGRYFCCLRDTLSQSVFAYLDFQGIWSYTTARAYTYPKVLESQLPFPAHYPWNPLQFSHPLSSLIFSPQNPTKRKLILPGHAASQGPLNPLACTAKRCMSLVGICHLYLCYVCLIYIYLYNI